ncbi:hypothetical protein BGX38DRAFT_517411 [Terfezia claveryi]|nr:hypothetical protein BGX38DRAFT_517411 [Terfezia claveryi]
MCIARDTICYNITDLQKQAGIRHRAAAAAASAADMLVASNREQHITGTIDKGTSLPAIPTTAAATGDPTGRTTTGTTTTGTTTTTSASTSISTSTSTNTSTTTTTTTTTTATTTTGSCQAQQQQQLQQKTQTPPIIAFTVSPGECSLLEYFPPIAPTAVEHPTETTSLSMGSAGSKIHSHGSSGSANRDDASPRAAGGGVSGSLPVPSNASGTASTSSSRNFVRALSSKRKNLWAKATSSASGIGDHRATSPPASSSGGVAAPRPRRDSRTGSPPKANKRKASLSAGEGPSTTINPQTNSIPETGSKPLTIGDLTRMFSGAPQFSLYHTPADDHPSSSHYTHLPLVPTVTFPYSLSESHIPQGSDHVPFPPHPSFSLCDSALPARGEIDILDPLPSELPPMSAFQGLEVGSCGWEHYVLAPLGDANIDPEEEDIDRDGRADFDEGGRERGMTMGGRELAGVMRSVEVGWVVERLKELGELYWVGRSEGDTVEGGDDGGNVDGESSLDEAVADENAVAKIVVNPATPSLEEAFTDTTFGKMKGTARGPPVGRNGKPGILSKYTHLELYTNLFTRLLYPPTKITTADYHDPYSLRVQIASLTHALGMSRVWLDFSLVEWRIRLGQVLWGHKWNEDTGGNNTERVWLLLQILLACELVVRLDAVAASDFDEQGGIGGTGGNGETKEEMFRSFREIRKKKVEWDILLARRWLENVVLVERETVSSPSVTILEDKEKEAAMGTGDSPKKKGWFSALSSSPPSTSSGAAPVKYDPSAKSNNPAYDALIIPRDQATQLSGLLFFAKEINWPQVDVLSQTLVDNLLHYVQTHPAKFGYSLPQSVASTPTPMSPGLLTPSTESPLANIVVGKGTIATMATAIAGSAGSYFTTSSLRPKRLRELSSRSSLRSRSSSLLLRKRESASSLMRNNTMGSGGWLSRSWFTGLVLPGESLPHLLISALLENDINMGERVGWEAELYGGFILPGEGMWWSSFCVVGRVLGRYAGSRECLGWIGTPKGVRVLTTANVGEEGDYWCAGGEDVSGWVAVRAKQVFNEVEEGDSRGDAPTVERVDKPREVARMSCILGRGWKEGVAVLERDFVVPKVDGKGDEGVEIMFEGLVFRRSEKEGFASDEEEEKDDERDEEGLGVYDVSASFVLTEGLDSDGPSNSTNNNSTDESTGRTRHIIFHLTHDITFITAYPCLPPAKLFPSQDPLHGHHHALHRSHLYSVHPLSSLPDLAAPQQVFSMSKPGETNLEMLNRARRASVMVIDASEGGEAGGYLLGRGVVIGG